MYTKLHLLHPTGPTRPKSTTLRSDAEHMCASPQGEGPVAPTISAFAPALSDTIV